VFYSAHDDGVFEDPFPGAQANVSQQSTHPPNRGDNPYNSVRSVYEEKHPYDRLSQPQVFAVDLPEGAEGEEKDDYEPPRDLAGGDASVRASDTRLPYDPDNANYDINSSSSPAAAPAAAAPGTAAAAAYDNHIYSEDGPEAVVGATGGSVSRPEGLVLVNPVFHYSVIVDNQANDMRVERGVGEAGDVPTTEL
jgi:hypothetical protein